MRVVCLLFEDGKPLIELAEACYRLTPRLAVRENEALFLEIDQCQRLYNEHIFLLRLQSLLRRFGRQARVGISDDPAFALAFARTGLTRREELPLESLLDIANPFFRDDDIISQITRFIIMLGKLGVRNFAEFAALPPKTIAPRFRALGFELHHKVAGGILRAAAEAATADSALWPVFTLPEKINERIELDYYGNCTHLEPLLFVLRPLISRVMARLAGRGERLSSFELDFEFEKLSTTKSPRRVWGFDLPLPQGSEHAILPIIRERLAFDLARQPLTSEVTAIEIRVSETSPGQYWQRNFFNRREEEQEAWNSLIARLCEKLGHEHSFVAAPTESYRPERAWKKIKHEEKHVTKQRAQASVPMQVLASMQTSAHTPARTPAHTPAHISAHTPAPEHTSVSEPESTPAHAIIATSATAPSIAPSTAAAITRSATVKPATIDALADTYRGPLPVRSAAGARGRVVTTKSLAGAHGSPGTVNSLADAGANAGIGAGPGGEPAAFNGSCALKLTSVTERRTDANIETLPGSSSHAHIQRVIKAELMPFELPFPQRPLRILKYPQPLMKTHNALVIVDPHVGDGKRWEIADWEGPERLSGEWWGEAFERDYFRVGTHSGEQLWIYRVPNSDQIFLHGYFD